MIYIVFIMALTALCCGCASLLIAIKERGKKDVVVKETTVKVEHAPVEHPFTYDAEKGVYLLDGSLEVSGGLSCLKIGATAEPQPAGKQEVKAVKAKAKKGGKA